MIVRKVMIRDAKATERRIPPLLHHEFGQEAKTQRQVLLRIPTARAG